jgi:UDP-glucose 4-epimerase
LFYIIDSSAQQIRRKLANFAFVCDILSLNNLMSFSRVLNMTDLASIFTEKKVLITGGLGFIGSNLAGRLVKLGARVLLVDSMVPEYGGNLFNVRGIKDCVKINIADVRDEHGMRYLVQGQDFLFNLAGQTSHLDSMENPYTDLEINCRSQLFTLETCRKFNPQIRVVFASTRQIYGVPAYLPVDEKHPICPVDVNGINKMAGEWYHILYNNVYGIRASALRLTNSYGPRMRIKDARQTFLGLWIRQLIEGKCIKVFGDGQQVRDFNFIDDVVEALLLCAANPIAHGCVYNLGADDPINLRDLAELIIKIFGRGEYQMIPFPLERKAIDIGNYYADYRAIRSSLGWIPRISLPEGLKQTLLYYQEYISSYLDNSD